MEYEIRHNVAENKFEAIFNDAVIGFVDYHLMSDHKVLVVPHTEVNVEYGGQGIAGALTKSLLEYAMELDLKVLPVCSYTRTYMAKHPEYQGLIE